jgi:hypothetical protein
MDPTAGICSTCDGDGRRHPESAPDCSGGALIRSLAVLVAVLCLGLIAASTVQADSAVLSVTNTAGASDPAAQLPRVFTLSGVSAVPSSVFVKYRAPGGAECAANANEDSGSVLEGPFGAFWSTGVNGDFRIQQVMTWPTPETVMFCIWIASNEYEISPPITQLITFRAPSGSVSATINPSSPEPDQSATLTVGGASEAPAAVVSTITPGGGGAACAPTPQSDSGQQVLSSNVNGAFSVQEAFKEEEPGTYLLCTWLMPSQDSGPPALAGPEAVTFVVGYPTPPPPPVSTPSLAPPPRCVVPTFDSRMSLGAVKRRIVSSHCRVGRIVYAHSRSVRRGDVVRLSPRPHTHLAHLALVSILVSAGR